MRRRAFACGLVALATCLGPFGLHSDADVRSSRLAPRRIGVLLTISSPEGKEAQAFRQGLLDAGYAEGRDVVIEWRSANGDYARVPELAADLVQRKVDVIVVQSTPAAQAAKRATSTIPIVMAIVADPVGSGLVANLAHPGGNVTGLSTMTDRAQRQAAATAQGERCPELTRVAVLWNPDTPYHPKVIEELKAAAPSLSIELKFRGRANARGDRSGILSCQPSARPGACT